MIQSLDIVNFQEISEVNGEDEHITADFWFLNTLNKCILTVLCTFNENESKLQ